MKCRLEVGNSLYCTLVRLSWVKFKEVLYRWFGLTIPSCVLRYRAPEGDVTQSQNLSVKMSYINFHLCKNIIIPCMSCWLLKFSH